MLEGMVQRDKLGIEAMNKVMYSSKSDSCIVIFEKNNVGNTPKIKAYNQEGDKA